eukprot:8837588-Pyramimonas_sp.AAC.1
MPFCSGEGPARPVNNWSSELVCFPERGTQGGHWGHAVPLKPRRRSEKGFATSSRLVLGIVYSGSTCTVNCGLQVDLDLESST